jgi:glycosyltransferase involved in cell wall biosynthesis
VWSLPWRLRRWDRVVFLTERATLGRFFDHLVANGTGYRAHAIIPNPVIPESFPKNGCVFRDTYGFRDGLLFLCVANYSVRKNQELAVRAFHRAALAGASLVFIGSELGTYGRRVEKLARELATERPGGRVVLLENVSPELTRAAFVACDVFVLSAKAETQPFVILEAMACEKPWISTDTGCVSECPGGLVVRGESAFARALQRLAANGSLRAQLGAEGAAAVRERYCAKRVLDDYEELMRHLVPSPKQCDPAS